MLSTNSKNARGYDIHERTIVDLAINDQKRAPYETFERYDHT